MSLFSIYSDMASQFEPDNEVHKTLTQVQKISDDITASSERYDDTGLELLLQVSGLLVSFSDINPDLGQITIDFRNAVGAYSSDDAETLGDAFDVHRPDNWNQPTVKRERNEIQTLVRRVDKLNADEMNINKAFFIAGQELSNPRGWSTARRLYYEHYKGVHEADLYAQTTAEQNIKYLAYLDSRNSQE